MSAAPASVVPSPPHFLGVLAHPVRWRLLSALARSDLRVGELCARAGLRQSLASYHVARLCELGVVERRRSSADGREAYYALDLERCTELLADTGGALHPGLRLAPVSPAWPAGRARASRQRTRVLFLCTGNSARSQIAEALVQRRTGGFVEACSAGSHPRSLHPNAVRVLRARGIDIADRSSKHLDRFLGERFDYVVSLCDRVREICPEFPGHPSLIHWSVPDPSSAGDDDEQTYRAFERTAEELESRIGFLLGSIESSRGR